MSPFSPTTRAVAALSLTQLLGWGGTFWLPAVTGPAMSMELGLTLPMVMAGPTVMLLVMAAVSWPLGGVLERHGARPVMMLGSLLGAVGLLALSAAGGQAGYFLAWAIIGVAGAGMLTTPAQVGLREVAGEGARRALGLLVLAGGLTSTLMWPLTGLLQAQWGWRMTCLVFAALLLLVCLPVHAMVLARRPRASGGAAASVAPAQIHRPRFLLLALSFGLNGLFTWGFALTIIILFEQSGLDHGSAVMVASLIGMAQWAGRLVDMLGGQRLSGLTVGLLGAALFPVSFIMLLAGGDMAACVLFAMLYGLASGVMAVTRTILPLQLFPSGAYARASARLALPLNLAFALAPPAFTAIMTTLGPQAALWLASLLSLMSFAALVALAMLQRRAVAPG